MFQCFRNVACLLCIFSVVSVSAVDYQKPGAPVRLADNAAIELVQNETRIVSVRFFVHAEIDRLRVHLHPSEQLRILSSPTSWVFSGELADPQLELEIVAPTVGDFPLMFTVISEQGEMNMSRVLGPRISVRSGSSALNLAAEKPAQEKARTLESGRRIHWVPAQSPQKTKR